VGCGGVGDGWGAGQGAGTGGSGAGDRRSADGVGDVPGGVAQLPHPHQEVHHPADHLVQEQQQDCACGQQQQQQEQQEWVIAQNSTPALEAVRPPLGSAAGEPQRNQPGAGPRALSEHCHQRPELCHDQSQGEQ